MQKTVTGICSSQMSETIAHSKQHFTEYRNHWWNKSFIEQAAKRLGLHKAKTVLDVGCGQCHWSLTLLPFLATGATVHAIDSDDKWCEGSYEISEAFKKENAQLILQKGNAGKLDFEDNTFDLVTCQTLLIHVKNPALVIAEMKRVLKPGGIILCAEPNNIVQNLIQNSVSVKTSVEDTLEHVKYALLFEKGKIKYGHGNNSIGDLLPGMLSQAGFRKIEARLSDKVIPVYPPYNLPEQEATLMQWASGAQPEGIENSEKNYFEAMGKASVSFYRYYREKYKNETLKMIESLEKNEYHSAGGTMLYLVSGVK